MRRSIIFTAIALAVVATALSLFAASEVKLKRANGETDDTSPKIAIAYVEWFRKTLPDPSFFTHLIYIGADFNDNCDGVFIPTPDKLREMSELKQQNPDLKIIVGFGDDKKYGFCEMAGDKKKRKSFALSVKNLIDSLNLDGVDLDWEWPTLAVNGHKATPDDAKNYVLVVKELRKVLGKDKWISFYSNNKADYVDVKHMAPYVDYVNVSGYNLAIPNNDEPASRHQSPLYPSRKCGEWCIQGVVERHIARGVPPEKILVGIPFYGRGREPFPTYVERPLFDKYSEGTHVVWDEDAQAPYYADKDGNLVLGFDDERSIKAKFDFIRANNLPGVFVWNYDADYPDHRLAKTIQRLRK